MSSQVDLRDAFRAKAHEFRDTLKVGRTQLQDAVPMTADVERCKALLDQSLVLTTPLARLIGYSTAASLSKKALAENRALRDVVEEDGVLGQTDLDRVFDGAAAFAQAATKQSVL